MCAANTSFSKVDAHPSALALLLVLFAAGCFAPPTRPPPPGKSLRGIPAARLQPGTPWTGWDDAREPLVSFEFMRGWNVESANAPTVAIARALDRATDGRHAARVTAAGTGIVSRVVLRPPAPIPIPEPFDSVEVRLSIGSDAAPDVAGNRPFIRVELETSAGEPLFVHLGRFPAGGWRLAHRRLPVDEPIVGARLTGIEIVGWERPADHPLYLAGLTFYLESRAPIVPAWRRDETENSPMAVAEVRAALGGAEDLTRLPPAPALPVEPRLDPDRALVEFAAVESGVRVTYALDLDDGPGRIQVRVGEVVVGAFEPIEWEPEGPWPRPDRAVIARLAEDGSAAIEFESGRRVRVRRIGRSLVMEAAADRRDIPYLACPRWKAEGAVAAPIAFLNAPGWAGPETAVFRTADGGAWAACAYLDPAASQATRWELPPRESAGASAAPIRAIYEPPAFGRRNPIRERVVLTVATRLEDVLPGAGRRATDSAPPAALPPDARETMADLDEIQPTDAAWSRDFLRRDAEGQWITGEDGESFAVKWPLIELLRNPELEAARAGLANPETALGAGLTARAPWAGVDYDVRAPGAARFDTARVGLVEWLRAAAREFGRPVIGRDDWIWLWADALDGWRVAPERARRLVAEPVLPLFGLARLRPLGEGLLPAPDAAASPEDWDRWTAALLWYGLAPGAGAGAPSPAAGRAARMTEPLLRRTRGRAPERMAFQFGGRLADAAEAFAGGGPAGSGRMYLRYAPALEIWINRSRDGDEWRVRVGGEDWRLPPNGWVARSEGLLAFSGLHEGRRVDFLELGHAVFFDPRGAPQRLRGVGADASVRVRRERTARGWAWDAEPEVGATFVELQLPQPETPGTAAAAAFAADGAPQGDSAAVLREGWLRAAVPHGAARLRIEWTPGMRRE